MGGRRNFRAVETQCNSQDAHVWVPSSVKEAEWATRGGPLNRKGWAWTGFFCSRRFGGRNPISNFYTVTGEDTRKFEAQLRNYQMTQGSGMKPGNHNHKCVLVDTDRAKGPMQNWSWEEDDCNESQAHFCETLA